MDPTIAGLFNGTMALTFKTSADHQAGLIARQGDASSLDQRLLTGVLMNELFTGSDPSKYADFAAASHSPTSQPWIAPPWVNPQGGPPAQTPK